MAKTLKADSESPDEVADKPADLSQEIIAMMHREPGETVQCVRLFDDKYRCNWWQREAGKGDGTRMRHNLEGTEMRVRRSSFLKVKKTAEGLSIDGVVRPLPR